MRTQNKYTKNYLQPLPIWQSIVMFGVPALLMVISVYILLPNFIEWGLSEYLSLFLASLIPFLGLFTASLAAYRIEGVHGHSQHFEGDSGWEDQRKMT